MVVVVGAVVRLVDDGFDGGGGGVVDWVDDAGIVCSIKVVMITAGIVWSTKLVMVTMGTKWSTSGPTKWEGSRRAKRQSFALTVVDTFDVSHHV